MIQIIIIGVLAGTAIGMFMSSFFLPTDTPIFGIFWTKITSTAIITGFLTSIYAHFSTKEELLELADDYKNGISWGDAKNKLFSLVNSEITPIRERYEEFSNDSKYINDLLQEGATRTRILAKEKINVVRDLIGIKTIS